MEEYAFLGSRGSGRKDKYSFVVDVLPKTTGKKSYLSTKKAKSDIQTHLTSLSMDK